MKVISSIYNKSRVNIFLDSIVLAVLPISEYQHELKGSEKKIANKLSEGRRTEFIAGRNIARMLLGKTYNSNFEIGRNVTGAPTWPNGICGSISYKRNFCAVLVGNKGAINDVGVDLEIHEELNKDVWKAYTTEEELKEIICPEMSDGEKANLVFSAKEAAFKCFSAEGKEISFKDIRTTVTEYNPLISISCKWKDLVSEGVVLKMDKYVVVCIAKYC